MTIHAPIAGASERDLQAISDDKVVAARKVDVSHARVLRLALPMMLAFATTPLLGIVDTAVIGRLGDAAVDVGVVVLHQGES